MSLDSLPNIGRMAFNAAFLIAFFSACARVCLSLSRANAQRAETHDYLPRAAMPTALLILAQLIMLASAYFFPVLRGAAGVGQFYLLCALPVPILWAAGSIDQQHLGWPCSRISAPAHKLAIASTIYLSGAFFAAAMFWLGNPEPGESIRQMTGPASKNTSALALTALWLLINAPWIEELVFRHWLLAWLARTGGGTRTAIAVSVLVTTAIFAIGHAGHTVPAWPKLAQMTAWGLGLAAIRIVLGTRWAIGLHLAWNLSAPAIAYIL